MVANPRPGRPCSKESWEVWEQKNLEMWDVTDNRTFLLGLIRAIWEIMVTRSSSKVPGVFNLKNSCLWEHLLSRPCSLTHLTRVYRQTGATCCFPGSCVHYSSPEHHLRVIWLQEGVLFCCPHATNPWEPGARLWTHRFLQWFPGTERPVVLEQTGETKLCLWLIKVALWLF